MVKKKYLTVKPKDVEWKVFVQTHSSYIRHHGNDSKAITYPDDKEMYFDRSQIRLSIIRHEAFHAFISSTDTEHNADMTASDQEELDCTVYGNNAWAIQKIVEEIVDFVLRGDVS